MKTLELKSRKNTTARAKNEVINFISAFDFSEISDLPDTDSVVFIVRTIYKNCNRARFELREGKFIIRAYDCDCYGMGSDGELGFRLSPSTLFNDDCYYINFKSVISAMEDFIAKINASIEAKETDIAGFLDYSGGWSNYINTIQTARKLESREEIL